MDDTVVAAAPLVAGVVVAALMALWFMSVSILAWWWRGFRRNVAADFTARTLSVPTIGYVLPAAAAVTYLPVLALSDAPGSVWFAIPNALAVPACIGGSFWLSGQAGAAIRDTLITRHAANLLWRSTIAAVTLAWLACLGQDPQHATIGRTNGTSTFGITWLFCLAAGVVWGLAGRPGRTAKVSLTSWPLTTRRAKPDPAHEPETSGDHL